MPEILSRSNIVITHGNGPQVGASLMRHHTAKMVPLYPLYACVAETQGSIGYLIETALEERLWRTGLKHRAVTITLLVPSSEAKEILEADLVRNMVGDDRILIACGGGGIPVAKLRGRRTGMEAVIDKDLASGLLATVIGADTFVSLTDVEGVYINHESKERTMLRNVSLGEIRRDY